MTTAIPQTAAVHALTAGAMATMILAVTTRATLGHTGRELRADGITITAYLFICAGAAMRVLAPFGLVDTMLALRLAALAWGGAFLFFLIGYGPILMRPRLGEP